MSGEAALRGGRAASPGFAKLLSDDRLARRAAAGDERAFATIFERHHQGLYRFCLAIVGNPDDAQDALQNTMASVLKALPGEDRRIDLKPWLYRIAHNEAIDLLRRRRDTRTLDAELPAGGSGLAEDMAVRDRLRRLIADMRELPERQRQVLVMRELSGLGFGEIGAVLGTSDAVARQTLYEARRSLQQMEAGREMSCDAVTRALSDGDGRVLRRRDVRAHLRTCDSCRRFQEGIEDRRSDFAALSPLPAALAASLLRGLLGGPGNGGGLAAALGGGAAKSVGASTVLKGAATVAAVAAIGVGAGQREGIFDFGGGGGTAKTESVDVGGAARAGGRPAPSSAHAVVTARRLAPRGRIADATANRSKTGRVDGEQAHIGTAAAEAAAAAEVNRGTGNGEPGAGSEGEHGASAEAHEAHPSGQGHPKQYPAAAEQGQETAGSHNAASGGSPGKGQAGSHPPPVSHPEPPEAPEPPEQPEHSEPPERPEAPEETADHSAAAHAGGARPGAVSEAE